MGLGVSGCISDTQSEIHLLVGRQTRNHILQMTSPAVACHEALLLPQLLEVCWLVELSSAEQVLPPVCVQQYHNSNQIHCCHVCVNYYQLSGSPSFCGRPLVSNVLAINTLEPSSNILRPKKKVSNYTSHYR